MNLVIVGVGLRGRRRQPSGLTGARSAWHGSQRPLLPSNRAVRAEPCSPMWFEDLTRYSYLPHRAADSSALNVGWLESGRPFATGKLAAAAIDLLESLVKHSETNVTRGMHYCDLCPPTDDYSGAWGHAEIRVVGADGATYAAPSLIHHYVAVHDYQPPQAFVDALMHTAELRRAASKKGGPCLACGAPMERRLSAKAAANGKSELTVLLECAACGARHERAWPDG